MLLPNVFVVKTCSYFRSRAKEAHKKKIYVKRRSQELKDVGEEMRREVTCKI